MKSLQPATVIEVAVNGTVLLSEDIRGLSDVRVEQRLSLPAQCELTFVELRGQDTLPLVVGDAVEVRCRGSVTPMFSGDITALHHSYEAARGRVLRVRAYDRLHRLRKNQPVRAHVDVSPADLARELAANLDVSVDAHVDGPRSARHLQFRHSDLDLLAEVCERYGHYFTLHDGTLHLYALDGFGDQRTVQLGDSLLEAHCEVNADPACRSVAAVGWDPLRAVQHTGHAQQPRSARSASASAAPTAFAVDGAVSLMGEVVSDAHHAEAMAQGTLDRRSAAEVVLSGTMDGDPTIHPGLRLTVAGLDADHDGTYMLTEVTHHLTALQGYHVHFRTDPPLPRPRPQPTSATLGVVCSIDDPDQLGRVQVSLPTLGDLESGWLEVLSVGAGAGKGLMALPDVGDRVLVLAIDGDPGRGVVLGGLFGADGWPDTGIASDRVQRFTWCTPGGQRVLLDDDGNLVRVSNERGSFIALTPDGVTVHAEGTGLTIEAPGQTLSLRARAIELDEA